MAKAALKPKQSTENVEKELKFNPEKTYKWDPEDQFVLNGKEFSFMYNSMMERRNKLLTELEQLNIFQQKLVEAVESGVAKEVEPESVEDKK